MRKKSPTQCSPPVVVGLCLALAMLAAPAAVHAQDVTIVVAPSVISFSSAGELLTVHTDIPYGEVVGDTVQLEHIVDSTSFAIPIDWWKADDRGNFVAKFLMLDVKTGLGLVPGEINALWLTGTRTDGSEFSGADEVLVKDRTASGSAGS
jgi:uncharacterized membrane protein